MSDTPLLDWTPPEGDRHGGTFVAEFDYERLNGQQARVYDIMRDGCWHTLRAISEATGDPEASVSARLRDLRRQEFGGFTIDRERFGDPKRGLHVYRLSKGKS